MLVVVEDGDVVARSGKAHGAGDDGASGGSEVADEDNGFRLAVAFVKEKARGRLPEVENLGIERFAGGDAVAKGAEMAFREVLLHDQAQGGGGCTPGGDGELLQGVESGGGIKFAAGIQGEDTGAAVPGAEEAGPGGFGTAEVGEVPVDIAGL